MKKLLWLVAGAGLGFVAARQFAATASGKRFFDDLDARRREFADTVAESYRQRQDDLRAAIGGSGEGPRK